MNTNAIWQLRDELIDARADGEIDSRDAKIQIDLLGDLANAEELGIDALNYSALAQADPEQGGARFTISGGDVLELPDRHLESDYDDRNGDGYEF